MNNKKTIGERVDKVVDKVSEKVERAKDNMVVVKEDVADFAHGISKGVKKTVNDSGSAVSDLFHK